MEGMRFPCEPPEYFAARVLRARKFDVEAALKLVADTSAWREEIKVAALCKKDPQDVLGCMEDELQVRGACARACVWGGGGLFPPPSLARVTAPARRARVHPAGPRRIIAPRLSPPAPPPARSSPPPPHPFNAPQLFYQKS